MCDGWVVLSLMTWNVEFQHCRRKQYKSFHFKKLLEISYLLHFCSTKVFLAFKEVTPTCGRPITCPDTVNSPLRQTCKKARTVMQNVCIHTALAEFFHQTQDIVFIWLPSLFWLQRQNLIIIPGLLFLKWSSSNERWITYNLFSLFYAGY